MLSVKMSNFRWWIGFLCGLFLVGEGVYVVATEEWQFRGGAQASGREAISWGIFTLAIGLSILILQVLTRNAASPEG